MDAKTSDWQPGPTVCRCCFTEGCYKDISTEYFWMGKREVYAEMLSETFSVSISYSKSGGPNSHSRLICEQCISRLRDAADFRRQVVECEKMFIQHLDPCTSSVEIPAVVLEPPEKEVVKLERVKLEKEASDEEFDDRGFPDDDDDDDDDMDDEPLMKLATKIPKKETMDLRELLSNSKLVLKRKAPATKTKPTVPAKKLKSKKEVKPAGSKAAAKPAPKPVEKKKKGEELTIKEDPEKRGIVPLFQVEYDRTLCKPLGTITDFKKLKLMQSLSNRTDASLSSVKSCSISRSPSPVTPVFDQLSAVSETVSEKELKKLPDLRRNALTVFEFSTAYPFIYGNNKFKCFVCSQHYLELALLKQHMVDNHTFASLKRLVNNRRENVLKVDINGMYCKICGDSPKDLLEMKIHLKKHDKDIDLTIQDNLIPFKLEIVDERYKCVICDLGFIKVRSLVVHMSVHFNNYSCEVCGTGFMTLRLLKRHLEIHESGTFSCDRCNKVFSTPTKLTLHVRGVHLKECPRRCPMCPERFNSNYKRTIHLQEVHNQVTRVHKCETCGRGFNLRYHLVCHVRSVHLQERNQQCDVCHQRYSNKESLKRHMVIHTGEKNHKCDVCGAAFLRRKNLKDHLRLHETE